MSSDSSDQTLRGSQSDISDRSDYSEKPSPHTAPRTSCTARLQILAGMLGNFVAWGNPAAFGVYQLYYQETLHLPASHVSWIGGVQVLLTYAMSPLAGRAVDAGHSRMTLCAGAVLAALGILATSFSTKYWHFLLAQGVCTGLGLGMLHMPAISVISSYFPRSQPFALAVSSTGTAMGSVVFPAVIHYLTPQVGFPWAVRCQAALMVAITAVQIGLLRPRLAARTRGPLFEWAAFLEPAYLLFAIGTFMFYLVLYFVYFYINTYAKNVVGFDSLTSIQLLLIVNAAGVPAKLIAGWVADRHLGPVNALVLALVVLCGIQCAWVAVADRVGMYLFAVFYGLTTGAAQCVFIGALASLTDDPTKMGARSGMVYLVAGVATMVGPPAAGAVIDGAGGGFLGAQIMGGVVLAVAALFMAAARCKTTASGWKNSR